MSEQVDLFGQSAPQIDWLMRVLHRIWAGTLQICREDAWQWYLFFSQAPGVWQGRAIVLWLVDEHDQIVTVELSALRKICQQEGGIFGDLTVACLVAWLYPMRVGTENEQAAFDYNHGLIRRWLHATSS